MFTVREETGSKAVALFNFERENEDELSLVKGQIIRVFSRRTEGWVAAENPKTQERGLVPKEYVRFVPDIAERLDGVTGVTETLFGDAADSMGRGVQKETPVQSSPWASGWHPDITPPSSPWQLEPSEGPNSKELFSLQYLDITPISREIK